MLNEVLIRSMNNAERERGVLSWVPLFGAPGANNSVSNKSLVSTVFQLFCKNDLGFWLLTFNVGLQTVSFLFGIGIEDANQNLKSFLRWNWKTFENSCLYQTNYLEIRSPLNSSIEFFYSRQLSSLCYVKRAITNKNRKNLQPWFWQDERWIK